MSEYKGIKGFSVQTLAADPDTPGWVGSIFYNSTSGTFKVVKAGGVTAGTWASGGTLNATRTEQLGTAGTQTSALTFGRSIPTPTAVTESYNGTSWTSVADFNTARGRGSGVGVSNTSALGIGGVTNPGDATVANTESWNGSAWTEINDLPEVRSDGNAFGTQTAAIQAGGNRSTVDTSTFSWDGTNWTASTSFNTARQENGATGIQTAGIIVGGRIPPSTVSAITESWNGSAWTEVGDLNTARNYIGAFGTQTLAIAAGGGVTPSLTATAITESWNGTSWTEVNDLAIAAKLTSSAAGTDNTSGLAVAGTATEEWTAPDIVINTLTTS
jgi:hypothetical protein